MQVRLLLRWRRVRAVAVFALSALVFHIYLWESLSKTVSTNPLPAAWDFRNQLSHQVPAEDIWSWRPDPTKLKTLYRLMNLTEDEVPSHLPLTLAPDYQYLLMNPNLCGTDQVDVLFIVHVRPSSLEKRAVLRATTCNESFFAPFKVRTLFLLGSVPNATLQALLEAEHRLYGDTLQGRFHDHYHNLSQKGVMGFNWITHYCPHVRYVFKMDDDAFVDTFKLLNKFLPLFDGKRRAFICNPWINNTMGILRTGKWKVDDHLFRGLRRYPFTYCSGFAMGITGDLIPSLYQAAFFAPFFWIDDVYLYGILPFLAGNVKYYGIDYDRNMSLNSRKALECMQKSGYHCPIVVSGGRNWEFHAMWNETLRIHRGFPRLPLRYVNGR